MLRFWMLLVLVLGLTGCVRDREERLPDESAGDEEIFQSQRRDVEARLDDRIQGLEVRFASVRQQATPETLASRPDLSKAVTEGSAAASAARNQLQQLRGSTRAEWTVLRRQTEDAVETAEAIWQSYQQTRR